MLIVHSAVSGITDMLEKLLAAASAGEHEAALEGHRRRGTGSSATSWAWAAARSSTAISPSCAQMAQRHHT